MNMQLAEQRSVSISREHLLAFVRGTLGGSAGSTADEEGILPPGPWDPYIRRALDTLRLVGPHPEPWRAFGGFLNRIGEEVRLNPQPLPPRHAFLIAIAEVVIERTELLQEIALAANGTADRSIIIVGGITRKFVDDWCGNGFAPRWPGPGPVPPWWPKRLDAFDLMVLATRFETAAREAFAAELRGGFEKATAHFADAGFARLESLSNG